MLETTRARVGSTSLWPRENRKAMPGVGAAANSTPESWKGFAKSESPRRLIASKVILRLYRRCQKQLPLSALWRGEPSTLGIVCLFSAGIVSVRGHRSISVQVLPW